MAFFEHPSVTLYLVRHGQSAGNVDENLYRICPDHVIGLTELGHQQALDAGEFLRQELSGDQAMMLRSPYKRTRETEKNIYEKIDSQVIERIELVEMAEQQLGVFNGVPDDERASTFPREYARYKLQNDFSGSFWARPPQGESPYDVFLRAGAVASQIRSAHRRTGMARFILVAHGYFINCFIMNWCNLPFEWFSTNSYINNAEIVKIVGGEMQGVVFTPPVPTAEKPHAPNAHYPAQGEKT